MFGLSVPFLVFAVCLVLLWLTLAYAFQQSPSPLAPPAASAVVQRSGPPPPWLPRRYRLGGQRATFVPTAPHVRGLPCRCRVCQASQRQSAHAAARAANTQSWQQQPLVQPVAHQRKRPPLWQQAHTGQFVTTPRS